MKKMFITPSPLEHCPNFKLNHHVDLFVKRDDLLPFPGGGNKYRKMECIVNTIDGGRYNAVITNGGVQSNHARVVAIMAAQYGWKCVLVLHGNENDVRNPTGNLLLMKLTGAIITIVRPDNISYEINVLKNKLRKDGNKPYIIPGGGHCLEGTYAYYSATKELEKQCDDYGITPDYIIVASGTGATQAGIELAVRSFGWDCTVIGISVGRSYEHGLLEVKKSFDELNSYLDLQVSANQIIFYDQWKCGGYGIFDERIKNTIKYIARKYGVLLDPVYTAKAFTGMLDLIDGGNIKKNSTIIFWHTGGLLNLVNQNIYEGC